MHDDDVERELRQLKLPEADPAFLSGLHARLQAKVQPEPRSWLLAVNLSLGAAVALLLVMGPPRAAVAPIPPAELSQIETVRTVYSLPALQLRVSTEPYKPAEREHHVESNQERGAQPPHDGLVVGGAHGVVAVLWHHVRAAQPR